MADRRPLAAAVHTLPDADPDQVRAFITQEPRSRRVESHDLAAVTRADATASRVGPAERPRSRRRPRNAGMIPVALVPVTVRLRPEIAGALKRASLERQLASEDVFHQQDLVELVLEPWLRAEGYLT